MIGLISLLGIQFIFVRKCYVNLFYPLPLTPTQKNKHFITCQSKKVLTLNVRN